jgi:hypothetical protein
VSAFLSDITPRLIQFDTGTIHVAHKAVVQLCASDADAHGKAHDRVAVNASEPFHRTDAAPFRKGSDDIYLLIERENVHGAKSLN